MAVEPVRFDGQLIISFSLEFSSLWKWRQIVDDRDNRAALPLFNNVRRKEILDGKWMGNDWAIAWQEQGNQSIKKIRKWIFLSARRYQNDKSTGIPRSARKKRLNLRSHILFEISLPPKDISSEGPFFTPISPTKKKKKKTAISLHGKFFQTLLTRPPPFLQKANGGCGMLAQHSLRVANVSQND